MGSSWLKKRKIAQMYKSRHDQGCLDNLDDIMFASASSVIKLEEDTALY